jgi:signal transduction histidine kinase
VSFLVRHLLLFLSLLAVLVGVLLAWTADDGPLPAAQSRYLTAVQERVLAELERSDADLLAVEERFAATPDTSFGNLLVPTRYPYLLFRGGRLLFWSEARLVPTYAELAWLKNPFTVALNGGQYLVNRRVVRQQPERVEAFSLIPLYRTFGPENPASGDGYNPALFGPPPTALRLTPGPSPFNVYAAPGTRAETFLFTLQPPRADQLPRRFPTPSVVCWVLAVGLLGAYVFLWLVSLSRQRRYEAGLGVLALYVLGVRALLWSVGLPVLFGESDFVDPTVFSTPLAPSLGDWGLNLLVGLLLGLYVTRVYFRSRTYRWLIATPPAVQAGLSVGLVLLGFGFYGELLASLNRLYTHSSGRLDLRLSLYLYRQPLRLATLGLFVLASAQYFLVQHMLVGLFIRLNQRHRPGLAWLVGGVLLAAAGWLLFADLPAWLLLLQGAYFAGLYLSRLPYSLYSFRYQTSIYLFAGAVVCALAGAYVVFRQETAQTAQRMRRFGQDQLAENDRPAEALLDQMNRAAQRDTLLGRLLLAPTLPREAIGQRLREAHLDPYFDRYEVAVTVFDAQGNGSDTTRLVTLAARFGQSRYRTPYAGVFFVKQPDSSAGTGGAIRYVDFVRLTPPPDSARPEARPVFVVLTLTRPPAASGEEPETAPAYNHAIFDGQGRLVASAGAFNFRKRFPATLLKTPALYQDGLWQAGYRLLGVVGKNGRRVVVSAPVAPFSAAYAGFSFLFLLLVFVVMLLIAGYATRYGFSTRNINFTARIQIFLHGAFLLPLLLVVGLAVGILARVLLANQEQACLGLARSVGTTLLSPLNAYILGRTGPEAVGEAVQRRAAEAGRDLNVYDAQGRLLLPSQPGKFNQGLPPRYLNPAAYARLVEERDPEVLLPESLGKLTYKTAYVALNAANGRLLGVLSVPFYEAGTALESQVLDVIGSILNVFTTVFLVLLVVSYVASRSLTVPLRLITQKIRRTNLDKLNEPLDYKSDDEIGLLIGEYNRMLVKLEDSKQALSQSEKQSAWREMAKQVAHEIKNPLTPMKLTLQQLQRILPADNPATKRLIDRAFNSLIDQIDNLSDIANSFSDFAKMPVPKNEVFDLVPVVQKTLDLYADDRSITLRANIRPRSAYVLGDPHLLGRILTNLIINAIQAVPATRKPEIRLNVNTGDEFVVLDVSDNGSGIPEAIRHKVFMPNFSTKDGGSGVGLAVAKRGVEHAHGSIWFESEEGRGTTFFISLPLADVKQAKPVGVVS